MESSFAIRTEIVGSRFETEEASNDYPENSSESEETGENSEILTNSLSSFVVRSMMVAVDTGKE